MQFVTNPELDNADLNRLFSATWPSHTERDFAPLLQRSLVYIGALSEERLIGFVNVAGDGGEHAFLLDPTVHPDFQRHGIGTALVRDAARAARERGARFLHVDYEPRFAAFYEGCGFSPTNAGLMRL